MEHSRKPGVSPETALASDIFDKFCAATTLKAILGYHRHLCELLHIKPTNFPQFYPKLKSKLKSWKAQALWAKFDKKASHKCYNRGKACPNTRVLIIGAGPCGLRAAIEAQLLGAKVVVVEKRDKISRNNVLHLWPFVIQDLRALGAKKFFGRFCAGSIDHISIRQLQCILLKVALILGVEIHEGIGFESLLPPPDDQSEERIGWRAAISPPEHPVSQYEFDVLIGADGKRNTLEGFGRKEFRGKLAIAITANFINKRTRAEARVAEISGVAFIFNQKFFKDLYAETGIDLENIVYYKDDTHYFVMTAKKTSLINKGVILNDYSDTAKLLAPENVDKNALMEYAKEAADFSTNYKLPSLEFAVNHFGQPDVAMFDFTSMYAAVNASRVVEKKGHKLFMTLVGDSLLEPFWPTGSGCARGFLSSMDACWAVRNWGSGQMNPLEVLAERESIYRILGQTTPENLNRDFSSYTLDPHTRYPNLNTRAVLPVQVKNLYSTDEPANVETCLKAPSNSSHLEQPKKRRRKDSQVHPDTLLQWLKRQVVLLNDIHITDFTSSFKDGRALCGIIHRYRPDLIDFHSLRPQDVAKNNQLAFDILERELGIPPVMTGREMEECDVPDKLTMLSYLSQVYDLFRGEIPHIKHPKLEELNVSTREELTTSRFKSDTSVKASHVSLLAHLTNQQSPRSRPPETLKLPQKMHITSPTTNDTNNTAQRRRKRRSGVVPGTVDRDPHFVSGAKKGAVVEDFDGRIKNIEAKLKGVSPATDKKPKDLLRAIGKIEKTDWNFKEIEKKIEESKWGKASKQQRVEKVPKWSRQQFVDKFSAVERKLLRKSKDDENAKKYAEIDLSLKKLTQKIKDGSTLEQGERGANKVSAMAAQLTKAVEPEKSVLQKSNSKSSLVVPAGSASELCHFCNKRVYLMERLSAEGRFFHRGCFRCEYCSITLRLGNYAFDRDGKFGNRFFCPQHFGMSGTQQKRAYRRKSEELRNLANKENILKSSNQPKTPEVAKLERDTLDRGGTPERIEFENLDPDAEEDGEAIPSEMDEDEWTDRNFGASTGDGEIGSSEELSDLSESEDDSEDDDQEGFAEALDVPLTADETRRLAEDWTRRYSNHKSGKSPGTTAKEEDGEDSESAHESDDSQGRYSTQEYDSEDDESETATEGEEELKARELRKQEVRVDIVERKGRAESESDTEVMFHSPLDSSYYNSPSSLSLLSASDYPTSVDRRARFSSPVGGANKNYRALSLVSLFERGTEVQQEFRPSTSMPSLIIQGALPLGDIDSSASAVPTVLVSRSESIKSSEDKSPVEVVPASSAFLDAKPAVPKNLSLNNLVSGDNAQNLNESKALPLLTSVSSSMKPIPKNLSVDSSLDQLAHQTVGKTGAISCSLLLGPAKIAARNSSIDTSSDNLADRSVSDKSNLSAPIKKNKKSKRNEPVSDGTASSIPSASGSPVFAPKFAKFSLPKRVPDLKSTSENSTPSLSPQLKRKISTKNSTGSVSSSVTPSVSGTPAESPTLERKVSIVKQYLSGQKGGKESDTEISLVKPADKQLKKSSSIHTISCFAPPSYVSVGTGPASSDLSAPSKVNGLQKSPTSSAVCKPERPKLSEEEKKNLMKNFFAKAETLSKPSNLNSKKSPGKQGKKLIAKGSGKKKSTSNSASKTKDKDGTLKVDTSIKSSVKPEVKNHWAQDIVTKSLTPEISRKEYQNSQIQSFLRAKVVRGGSSTDSEKSKSVSKKSFRQKSDQKSETKSKKKVEKTQSLESTLSTPSPPAKSKYDKPSSKSSPTAVFKLDRSIFSKFMTENTSNLTDDRKSSLSSQQGKLKSSSVQRNSGSEELAKAFDAIYSSTVKSEKQEKVGPKKSTLILQPVRNTSLTIENRSQDEIKVSEHPHKIMYSKSLSHVPLKSKCSPDLFLKSPKPVSVPSVKSVTSLISELNKKASSLAVPNPKSSPSPERAEHVLKASLQIQPQNPPPTSNEHFAPPPRRAKVKVSVTEAEPTLLQKIAPSTRKAGEKGKNECILM